jgi:hypothetical protein
VKEWKDVTLKKLYAKVCRWAAFLLTLKQNNRQYTGQLLVSLAGVLSVIS